MTVLFCSRHPLERAENLHAIFNAYPGDKVFKQGLEHIASADDTGYGVVVCDEIPVYRPNKGTCKSVFIGHGIPGIKSYGLDEPSHFIDDRVCEQIDYAISPSEYSREILAQQLGISIDKVLPLGFPRTDAYFNKSKGSGGTGLDRFRRVYLYAPTFRYDFDHAPLPQINWRCLDSLLQPDELIVVKRHYFTEEPIVKGATRHIIEVEPDIPTTPYLLDCDVLMTDYSSFVFDGYICNKPSVLAVDYLEQYKQNRGVYLDFPNNHGSRIIRIEHNEVGIVKILRDAVLNGMQQKDLECKEWACGACDGNSSKRVADLLIELDR